VAKVGKQTRFQGEAQSKFNCNCLCPTNVELLMRANFETGSPSPDAECDPRTTPIPNDVLASPHHLRSTGSGEARGVLLGRLLIRKHTHERSACKGRKTRSFDWGDL